MDFRIADTFTASLARLTGEEQKAVKTTAFDLQLNPASPGMSFHKLDKSKDKRFWSVRVSSDVRLIVHRTAESLLLCYVDHHDKAYSWAERRKIETHPRTGAAQIVEIRELVQEITVPVHVEAPRASARKVIPLAATSETELLSYGVPQEWIADLRAADEDGLLLLAEHLPAEAAEAVLALATGSLPRRPTLLAEPANAARQVVPHAPPDPFEHPDALRRFSRIEDSDELKRALEYPWDRWLVFLHPAQRELIARRFGGPARVAGSAGTGKTVVAIHRAAHLARVNPDARVLLTTFSDALANALRIQLGRLIGVEPRLRERIDVESLDSVAVRLHQRMLGGIEITSQEAIRDLVRESAAADPGHPYTAPFLISEWRDVVDAWQITSWESYRDVARLGRKTRLSAKHREALWTILNRVRSELNDRQLSTQAALLSRLATHIAAGARSPYDFVVVDEAQDVSVAQLRFIAALGVGRPDALFFAGDLGQRIFQLPFSWRSLGVDLRGRSETLRMNYRTSQQIRAQADRLLGRQLADVDGNIEDRAGTISAFNGPPPLIRVFDSGDEESQAVGEWIARLASNGVAPGEIGVFVRSAGEVPRATAALSASGLAFVLLDESMKTARDRVSVGTMPLSKGLEFRAVAAMACDDEVLPLQSRIESVTDDGDLEDAYETERNLLYVACTRAREHLQVSGVRPGSEFITDLRSK